MRGCADEEVFGMRGGAKVLSLSLSLLAVIFLACDDGGSDHTRATQVVYRAVYSPCGDLIHETGALNGSVNYTSFGHEKEEDLNTLDFGARHYSASLCRFLSVDPEDEDLSAYGYAGGSLLNVIDPDGRAIKIPAHRCAMCGGAPFLKPAEANYLAPSFLVLRDVINVLASGIHWFVSGGKMPEEQVQNMMLNATTGIPPIGFGMATSLGSKAGYQILQSRIKLPNRLATVLQPFFEEITIAQSRISIMERAGADSQKIVKLQEVTTKWQDQFLRLHAGIKAKSPESIQEASELYQVLTATVEKELPSNVLDRALRLMGISREQAGALAELSHTTMHDAAKKDFSSRTRDAVRRVFKVDLSKLTEPLVKQE